MKLKEQYKKRIIVQKYTTEGPGRWLSRSKSLPLRPTTRSVGHIVECELTLPCGMQVPHIYPNNTYTEEKSLP